MAPKTQRLQVWWIPQVPGVPFYIPVKNVKEARLILNVLAAYDFFQLNHKIKPDFANAGGLRIWDDVEKGWVDWCDEKTGNDIDEIMSTSPLEIARANGKENIASL
jgi:hypothetical protein